MQPLSIGFIGFGEAGSTIAGGLLSAGVTDLYAFDINTGSPAFGLLIMAEAASRRQDSIAKLGLSSRFGPEGPRTYRELLKAITDARGVRSGA